MVGELSARHALSKEVVEGVSERTGGVPLFVEEVTRLLLERGEAGGLQAIPPTLATVARGAARPAWRSARSRADRRGLGARFHLRAVARGRRRSTTPPFSPRSTGSPTRTSSSPRARGHQANYRFKHALIQDAAYDSLLKSRRQALHRRAAEILRDQPERAAAEPEVIAHHFTQAGLDDLAIEWWGKAGDQALRRSAFQEAIAHLGKAIAMADKAAGGKAAGASGERRQLHVAYGNALIAARGYRARRRRPKPSPEPASSRLATRTRPSGWRPTMACGSAAMCGASCRR